MYLNRTFSSSRSISLRGHAARAGRSLLAALALAGCAAVGPDFKSPDAPAVTDSYTPAPLPATTAATTAPGVGSAGLPQHFAFGATLTAQWWTLFHSEPLNGLIEAALAHNPSLASARATLRQARENFNAQYGSLKYPSVSGSLGANRERQELVSPTPTDFNLYNAQVNVSYTLDVFGGTRRTLENLVAAVDYQSFEVEAAYQTLVSNVVTTAVQEASLRAQLQATQALLDAQEQQLGIVERQLAAGGITRATLLSQRTLVAQTRAQIPPLEKQLAQTRNQLAVYVGKLPSESGLPEFHLDTLQLPQELPVSLPSGLVRQRPDIRAAEALLHEASAQLGVAIANQYPQFTLSASYTGEKLDAGTLGPYTALWSLGAGLTQPIFNGGSLSAKRRAAAAAYEAAEADYRQTVLKGFQNVADALRAVDADANELKAQAEAEAQARESLELSTRQYALGGVSHLQLLDAQRTYEQTRINLVSAQAARYADTAALFLALGGGWWNRPPEPVAPVGPS